MGAASTTIQSNLSHSADSGKEIYDTPTSLHEICKQQCQTGSRRPSLNLNLLDLTVRRRPSVDGNVKILDPKIIQCVLGIAASSISTVASHDSNDINLPSSQEVVTISGVSNHPSDFDDNTFDYSNKDQEFMTFIMPVSKASYRSNLFSYSCDSRDENLQDYLSGSEDGDDGERDNCQYSLTNE